jgi:hypothetical protein
MTWLIGLFEFVVGVGIVVGVALSVARTVVLPRPGSSRLLRASFRAVLCGARLARPLPARPRRPAVLELVLPLTLLATLMAWLCWLGAGFFFLALAVGMPAHPTSMIRLLLLEPAQAPGLPGRAVGLVAWVAAALMIMLCAACMPTIAAAYNRREALVRRLSSQALVPSDAEDLLAAYLPDTFGPSYDGVMTDWDDWFSDVRMTHSAFPMLLAAPPAGQLCWLKAMVIMLDAAALVDALAPSRAAPQARALLRSGTACLGELAELAGVIVPSTSVSLEGREEYDFPDTVARVSGAGLPIERDEARAREIFQAWRIRYAPHATAISSFLRYDDPLFVTPEMTHAHRRLAEKIIR